MGFSKASVPTNRVCLRVVGYGVSIPDTSPSLEVRRTKYRVTRDCFARSIPSGVVRNLVFRRERHAVVRRGYLVPQLADASGTR
jgi:hypothetical protein